MNDPGVYNFVNLEGTIIIKLDFSFAQTNIGVTASVDPIENEGLKEIYEL